MTKEPSTVKRIGLSYFLNLIVKRKKRFPTRFFNIPLKTKAKTVKLSRGKAKEIIVTYFDVYFNEFFQKNEDVYFPLSGMLTKAKSSHSNTKGKRMRSVNLIWYLRPSIAYFSNIRLLKIKGSTSKFWKLEKLFRLQFDIDLLDGTKKKLNELRDKNLFYKC